MSQESYSAYKPSGIPWLGGVPGHWSVGAVKQNYEIQLGKMLQPSKQALNDTEVPYLKAVNVQWFKVRTSDPLMMWASPVDAEQYGIESGDLLVCEGGEGGRCGIVRSSVNGYIIQNALHRVRSREHSLNEYLQFVLYVAAARGYFEVLNDKTTIAHFTKEKLTAFRIPLPPLPEQYAIVRYLNHADRRIRRYVSAKRKLIALLEEEKQAVINRAVTRGLDPNVRLKPSGVEWLGDVPEHWKVRRAKFFFREADERSTAGTEELLSVSHITGVTPRKKSVTMFLAESNMGYKLCRPGDIVINTMWAFMAALGVARQNGLVSPSYGVYRPLNIERLRHDYIDSLLRTEAYRTNYLIRSTGITSSRLRLYPESFLDIPVLCPPNTEQDDIVEYLERATAATNAGIERARRQIALVQEYHTRLIADVVTGKLDVREAAAQLPDETGEEDQIDEDGLIPDNMNDGPYDAGQPTEEELAMESEVTV